MCVCVCVCVEGKGGMPLYATHATCQVPTYSFGVPSSPEKKTSYFIIMKTSRAFKQSNPLKNSPGSPSQSVSDSVGITSNCLLLAFPLSVSLTLLCLHCLCFSASHSARLLIVAAPVLKAAKIDEIKSHGNNLQQFA